MKIKEMLGGPFHVLDKMALVSGSSMVFANDFSQAFTTWPFDPAKVLSEDESSGRLVRAETADGIDFQFCNPPVVVGHLRQTAVPLNLIHYYNYFHFLIEWYPTILSLVRREVVTKASLLVTGPLHPNMWDAVHYLLSPLHLSTLQLRLSHAVTCDRVIAAPPSVTYASLIGGGVASCAYNAENISLIRRAFMPLWVEGAGSHLRKLLIRRISQNRNVANWDEVEEAAIGAGYEVVDPGRLTFREQIKLFSSASRILGPTGAWAANLIFVPEGATVAVFYPSTARSPNSLWSELGKTIGVQVDDVYCPVSPSGSQDWIHADFSIPMDRLGDLLRA
jgi:capsular polysaccharide biosynthesis protein